MITEKVTAKELKVYGMGFCSRVGGIKPMSSEEVGWRKCICPASNLSAGSFEI